MTYPLNSDLLEHASRLVSQMTLEEKADFCSGKDFWHLPGLERLQIPSIMVTDGPHGLRKQGQNADHLGAHRSIPSTCFPTASALASSWDTSLMEKIGKALGDTCVDEDVSVLLGPGMNIKRSPLCGRNFEYFSEDPMLSGQIAAALVNGIQSQGVGACLKHFAVNNQELGRMYMDAIVDDRALREIYLRGFEIAVKTAKPWTVMCAYNRLNGTYCSEHDWLLNQVLRGEWGFDGAVMTDWGAANDRPRGVAAGLDLEMPSSGGINDALVAQAVREGTLDEALLNQAVTRNIALSLSSEQRQKPPGDLDLDGQHDLARTGAAQSCVLLKNEDGLLPITTSASVALIGAFGRKPRFQGSGSSQVRPTRIETLFDALSAEVANLTYAAGYDPVHSAPDQALIDEAVALAEAADVAIVYAGLPAIYESEGFDRAHLDLPEQHNALINAVCAANPKTVVVLANGAPVTMPWIDRAGSVLEGYLGGQAGGGGIAQVLLGDQNPCGKLAETFPLALNDVPCTPFFPGENRQMQYREGVYVGYRYFDTAERDVLFPFGHGLSYTTFEYLEASAVNDTLKADGLLELHVTLRNSGSRAGAEVIQVYRDAGSSATHQPSQQLCGFAKVTLPAGATATVTITVHPDTFRVFDHGAQSWVLEAGPVKLRVGSSSRDIRLNHAINIVSNEVLSDIAKATGAPAFLPSAHGQALAVSDELFSKMLNKPAPTGEPIRPFHRNSSLAEIGTTWLGGKIKEKALTGFLGGMGLDKADPTTRKMFEEMANHMPLRALVLFQQGKTTFQQLDGLLDLLNGKFLRGLWRLMRNRAKE
ncbi:MAG: glycoside hydrolase family 3 C-terminal domain-containing protein [Gammaproteobacteria bacterium]